MPITLDGTNGITTPTYGGADTSEYLVPVTQFKNRIINGAMVIDQRNAGASVTATGSPFSVDRWQAIVSQASKFTIQQNAGSVTPPAGFTNYVGVTSSSAYSVLTGDYFILNQTIEGFNIADLGWGTANAKTITISFWVRSSLTGTFGLALSNQDWNYSYAASYTISSANTWEQKTITIAGATSGTWNSNNNGGVRVQFGLGVGSTYNGSAGSWASAQYLGTTGATSVVGTNGATFYITGVQLEVGSTATSFDYRPYGTELALCQRYFEKSYDPTVVPGTNSANGISYFYVARTTGNGYGYYTTKFQVTKRSNTTITIYSFIGTVGTISDTDSGANLGTVGVYYNSPTGFLTYNTSGGNISATAIGWHYTASAEL